MREGSWLYTDSQMAHFERRCFCSFDLVRTADSSWPKATEIAARAPRLGPAATSNRDNREAAGQHGAGQAGNVREC